MPPHTWRYSNDNENSPARKEKVLIDLDDKTAESMLAQGLIEAALIDEDGRRWVFPITAEGERVLGVVDKENDRRNARQALDEVRAASNNLWDCVVTRHTSMMTS